MIQYIKQALCSAIGHRYEIVLEKDDMVGTELWRCQRCGETTKYQRGAIYYRDPKQSRHKFLPKP